MKSSYSTEMSIDDSSIPSEIGDVLNPFKENYNFMSSFQILKDPNFDLGSPKLGRAKTDYDENVKRSFNPFLDGEDPEIEELSKAVSSAGMPPLLKKPPYLPNWKRYIGSPDFALLKANRKLIQLSNKKLGIIKSSMLKGKLTDPNVSKERDSISGKEIKSNVIN